MSAPPRHSPLFIAQACSLAGALAATLSCLWTASLWGLVIAGLFVCAAGGLSIAAQKSVLVPRSLRPLADFAEQEDDEDGEKVQRGIAMMMGILLIVFGLLATSAGILGLIRA